MRTKLVSALIGVAALAIMLIGAGSASATCTSAIHGEGSSLQRLAQERWGTENNVGASCTIAAGASVSYNPSGSGAGLEAWRANTGTGSITEGAGDHFIGTDDAPESVQVRNIERAAHSASVTEIPAAQAAVAIIINAPVNCTINNITNQSLQSVWHHDINNWERVKPAPTGTGCNSTIRRVVRRDSSGTTYQFKHYLSDIANSAEWVRLQEATENTNWPARASDLIIAANNGGGELAREVRENAGTIGYANLGDALARTVTIVGVQHNGTADAGATFAKPEVGAEKRANCAGIEYTATITLRTIWTNIYGSEPTIVGSSYSICTLTWILAVLDYARAGFTAAIGSSVKGFLEYVVDGTRGQTILKERNYAALPEPIERAARTIVAGIR